MACTCLPAGPHHEQIQIAEDAIGFSYSSLLGRFLDGSITSVEVEDPYVRSNHQVSSLRQELHSRYLHIVWSAGV